MKTILFSILLLLSIFAYGQKKDADKLASCCSNGKCTGSPYCTACKNCSRCQHCAQNGGTCGVCSPKTTYTKKNHSETKKTSQNQIVFKNNDILKVISKTVNLRSTPNSQSKVIKKLTLNDKLIFISNHGNWLKVKLPDSGQTGFIYKDYVKKQ